MDRPGQGRRRVELGSAGTLTLKQSFQMVSGTLGATSVTGRLLGNEMTLTAGKTTYKGQVNGNAMSGTSSGGRSGSWSAAKK